MKISMQSAAIPADLHYSHWDTAIVGEAVDPRGTAAIDFAKSNSGSIHTFYYNPQKLTIDFDGKICSGEEPEQIFNGLGTQSILLEATTLGFVEIVLCCRALKQLARRVVSFVYTEPQNYNQPFRTQVVHRRDFELSNEVEKFMGVPGNIFLSQRTPIKNVIFVGFEGQRLNRFLEQTDIAISDCEIVFGVPAFQPGWEMNAFANNLQVLKGDPIRKIHFCGAQNPLSAYEKLTQIYDSCDKERLLITPIGTKPHGIGSALFLVEHSNVGLIYDYPKRKKDRSENVETWHLFEAEF